MIENSKSSKSVYDEPAVYDQLVQPGPCEAFYLQEARAADSGVLDLACGSGRLSIPLARAGVRLIGLDLSAAMIAAARSKAAGRGLPCEFLQGDMRSFQFDRRFSLVMVTCNSLAHLLSDEDVLRCLETVGRHLAPGGRLALDVVNPDKAKLARAAEAEVVRRPRDARTLGLRERTRYDPERQVVTLRFETQTAAGATAFDAMELRRFFPPQLDALLADGGFKVVERFGGFDRRPFRAASPHQVMLAEPC